MSVLESWPEFLARRGLGFKSYLMVNAVALWFDRMEWEKRVCIGI